MGIQPWEFAVIQDARILADLSSRTRAHLLGMMDRMPPLASASLEKVNDDYRAILTSGRIEQCPGPVEGEQDEFPGTPRLVLAFNRRDVGTLRLLANDVNRA